ncbi:hypothetical protein HU200_033212 [Digitaria exilis]|uniref:Uncharacterized protein n=1 Tax=Digitaria exilis TaxID=1010633 RepID=A0A835BVG8_9POAL|nr:hypothetical protein HU200_033212 [Digitaria exilis]
MGTNISGRRLWWHQFRRY